MNTNRFGVPPLGFGLGLRAPHYETVLREEKQAVDWFEIISENFIEAHRGYWDFLSDVRRRTPIVMHGVSLSIGSSDPLNLPYLEKLRTLAEFLDVPWLSDHVCWTGVHGRNTHDLLPVPYTEAALRHMVARVREVQDRVGRVLALENPSTYVEFTASSMPEWEFMARLAEEADCGVLLDVNNVYVSAFNHGYDAKKYIDAIPPDRIVQIHLAGHENRGTHIIDTHDHHVIGEVWDLYAYTLQTKGRISTMVEWDDHIPDFAVLVAELDKARQVAANPKEAGGMIVEFAALMDDFHDAILEADASRVLPEIRVNPRVTPETQLSIYIDGYRLRLLQAIIADYPALHAQLGDNDFRALALEFIEANPPMHFSLDRYPFGFAVQVRAQLAGTFAADIAVLEGAVAEVFMGEESAPLDPAALQRLAPEDLGALMLPLRKASRLMAFSYPVNAWLDAERSGKTPAAPEAAPCHLYICRHENNVRRVEVSRAAFALLEALGQGMNVGEALDAVLTAQPGAQQEVAENLERWFAEWMKDGFFRREK